MILRTILRASKYSLIPILVLGLVGCVTTYPKDFLRASAESTSNRQFQGRQYDTKNEKEIISACAGVLQDLGFTIDDSETDLGLIVASKDRDATDAGQVAFATLSVVLSAFGGSSSNAFDYIDKVQKIRASIVTKLSESGEKTIVRVTFQRVVWNNRGDVSRMETLKDVDLYQGFFERLSKAIFLEAQQI